MPELHDDPRSGALARLLHDLRGPLNSALMHTQVLKRLLEVDPAATEIVTTLRGQLERLAEMLPDAVGLAALELGQVRRLNLRDVVDGAVREHALAEVTLAEGPWPDVRADERLLGQAIAHLVRNALEATALAGHRRGPHLSGEGPVEGRVALLVRDWGPGFPSKNPKALVRLLASTKAGHRGLGLVTVERIVQLHGGTLAFEEPGEGAQVRLTLPEAS